MWGMLPRYPVALGAARQTLSAPRDGEISPTR